MKKMIEVEGEFYIPATSSLADLATRVLKDGETFAVFDRHGDIRPLGFENQGLFHEGTRFLSRLKIEMNGKTPLLLSAHVKEDNEFLVGDHTNPDLEMGDGSILRNGTIHFVRTVFLLEGACFIRLEVCNFGLQSARFELSYNFEADFFDLFELRGITRARRGNTLPSDVTTDNVVLRYKGLDGVLRETQMLFGSPASKVTADQAVFSVELATQERSTLDLRISCRRGQQLPHYEPFDAAIEKRRTVFEQYRAGVTLMETTNSRFDDWFRQSRADLKMLLTKTEWGLYPFAGIPWYSCVFGRDGIITALETLWCAPDIARGVLSYLAAHQANKSNATQDCEPGKILHEQRGGEMAALGEIPFGLYYGTIDATPLFVVLAGRYFERTGDKDFIAKLWPAIELALKWIAKFGDIDGDRFVEYKRHSDRGIGNQGWKDSEDAIFHANGTLAEPPIALSEVQGYVFEAKVQAARVAVALGHHELSHQLEREADDLRTEFQKAFWCDEIGMYALALDKDKQPCRVRSSNAGQCLFSGIAAPEHAKRISEVLLEPDFFSGWGIRTIPMSETRYNPMSYHNGSIWPHDNALIAAGLARYGDKGAALQVLSAIFDASRFMELNRLPELYCGFARRRNEGPTLYPVACNPQAWASGAIFLLVQAVLGLGLDATTGRITFDGARLPETVPFLKLTNLSLPTGNVDINLRRDTKAVTVNVTRLEGEVDVVVGP